MLIQNNQYFNAGVAMAFRIDSLQRAINSSRFSPLQLNEETGTLNYEVIFSSCNSLLNEAWSKLEQKEKDLGEKTRKLIQEFMEKFPILIRNNKGEVKVNNNNFKRLMEMLDFYEKLNKTFLDNHNLNAPTMNKDLRGL